MLLGSLDSQIWIYDEQRADKPVQILNDHFDNVCALALRTSQQQHQPLLASGSWDGTARIFAFEADAEGQHADSLDEQQRLEASTYKWRSRYVLQGHQSAVWSVLFVDDDRYLTACADRIIRLFHGNRLVAHFEGHQDVVRALVLLPAVSSRQPLQFASASNDTTIRIWSLPDLTSVSAAAQDPLTLSCHAILRGHQSLVYDLAILEEDKLVSCGEDGTARIWDLSCLALSSIEPTSVTAAAEAKTETAGEEALLHTIWHHVESVWSVTVAPQQGRQKSQIVTGTSDGTVCIFTYEAQDALSLLADSAVAVEAEAAAPPTGSEGEAISAMSIDANGHVERDPEAIKRSIQTAAVEMQKKWEAKARVEAEIIRQPSSAMKLEAGDPSVPSQEEEMHDGPADADEDTVTVHIDVADDRPPLPLCLPRSGSKASASINPSQMARDFVEAHGLPDAFHDQIRDFIFNVVSSGGA